MDENGEPWDKPRPQRRKEATNQPTGEQGGEGDAAQQATTSGSRRRKAKKGEGEINVWSAHKFGYNLRRWKTAHTEVCDMFGPVFETLDAFGQYDTSLLPSSDSLDRLFKVTEPFRDKPIVLSNQQSVKVDVPRVFKSECICWLGFVWLVPK